MLIKNYNSDEKDIFWNELQYISKKFEVSIDINERKATGSFYTALELAEIMIEELFSKINPLEIPDKSFLEPCVGTGLYVFAYLKKIYELKYSADQVVKIINNIYVCDINKNALLLYRELFSRFVFIFFNIKLEEIYFNQHVATGLMYDVTKCSPEYISLDSAFPNIPTHKKFDIIITNPPYKILKAERRYFSTQEEYNVIRKSYSLIKEKVSKNFKYATEGVLNLYKLFIEEIIESYSTQDAFISLLIPNTILTDKTCKKLRNRLVSSTKIYSIHLLNENSSYIDAQQALCTILFRKGGSSKEVRVYNDNEQTYKTIYTNAVDKADLEFSPIIATTNKDQILLAAINSQPKIKDLPYIINMRGELDLTIHKNYISSNKLDNILIRGKNIGYYFSKNLETCEFASHEFIAKSKKGRFSLEDRIACQQIANINKERRITFSYISKNMILGNSCNFISITKNNYGIDLFFMLGLLNSSLINWYFKQISSNNHVSNYEIDCFPVPINSPHIKKISSLVQDYLITSNEDILLEIEFLIRDSFNLNSEEKQITCADEEQNTHHVKTDYIVSKYYLELKLIITDISFNTAQDILLKKTDILTVLAKQKPPLSSFEEKVCICLTEKYYKLKCRYILNHTTFKLSALDIEMIEKIPQGGNWTNIPNEIKNKSKRLIKINETGGRTTLYGRIDFRKPSYTITTYFNRPGNGTYVHPMHNRVISVREAARFQSFNDSYYFTGNKTQLLKQVGNAIPPLLAKQIAQLIINKTGLITCMDLFCGAGGLSHGFNQAGINTLIANDFDIAACTTFKINHPSTNIIYGDITNHEIKEHLIHNAKKYAIDIICGGPPCQGFSLAGKRFIDDPRNQLFKHFLEVVEKVMPKIVIMENVEGIISFQNGDIYDQIISQFKKIGFQIEGRTLMASDYGVPQKRKRVIIVCTRKDLDISPHEFFPVKITAEQNLQINALQAIGDLSTIECGESAIYTTPEKLSEYVKALRSDIIIND